MGSTDAIPIHVRVTYHPANNFFTWSAWRGPDFIHIDNTEHPTYTQASAVAELLFGTAALPNLKIVNF